MNGNMIFAFPSLLLRFFLTVYFLFNVGRLWKEKQHSAIFFLCIYPLYISSVYFPLFFSFHMSYPQVCSKQKGHNLRESFNVKETITGFRKLKYPETEIINKNKWNIWNGSIHSACSRFTCSVLFFSNGSNSEMEIKFGIKLFFLA